MAKAPRKAVPRGNTKKGLEPSKAAKKLAEKPVAAKIESPFPWPSSEAFGNKVGNWTRGAARSGRRKADFSAKVATSSEPSAGGISRDVLRKAVELRVKLVEGGPEIAKEILTASLSGRMQELDGVWTDEDRFHAAVMQASIGDLSGLANYLLTVDKPLHPEISHAVGFILQGNLLPPSEFDGKRYLVQAVTEKRPSGRPKQSATGDTAMLAAFAYVDFRKAGGTHHASYEQARLGNDFRGEKVRDAVDKEDLDIALHLLGLRKEK